MPHTPHIPVAKLAPPSAPGEAPAVPAILLTATETREHMRNLLRPSLGSQAVSWIMKHTWHKLSDTLFGDSFRSSDHVALEGIQDEKKYAVRKWEFDTKFRELESVKYMKHLRTEIEQQAQRLPNNAVLSALLRVIDAYDNGVKQRMTRFWNELLETRRQGAPEFIPYVKKLRNGAPMEKTLSPYIVGKQRVIQGKPGEEIRILSLSKIFERAFLAAIKKLENSDDEQLQLLAADLMTAIVLHHPSERTVDNRDARPAKPNRPVRGSAARRVPRAA